MRANQRKSKCTAKTNIYFKNMILRLTLNQNSTGKFILQCQKLSPN
jgi:hypothetical protein